MMTQSGVESESSPALPGEADVDLVGEAELDHLLGEIDASELALTGALSGRAEGHQVPALAAVRPALLGSLTWRPHIRSRHGISFLVVRSWLASARDTDLQLLKQIKAELPADLIAEVGDDIAELVTSLMGSMIRHVVPVTCGHSRRSDCFSFRLASAVASALKAEFAPCFKARLVPGSSHPKANLNLPLLEFVSDPPTGATLLVDDLTTSGFHMHEAIKALRQRGTPTLGVAWIGGTIRS